MALLPILEFPDPRLRTVAKPVETFDADLQKRIDDMFETMYAAPGVGLAATQIDWHRQLIVIDVSEEKDRPLVLINPRIVAAEGKVESEEGCLSVTGLRSTIDRAEKVTVKAQDLDGRDILIDADGLLAICLQHEIDHLEGVLFIDRMSRLKRSIYDKKVKKWQKDKKSA